MLSGDQDELLLTQLWDIRATFETQLRRLTTTQRSIAALKQSIDPHQHDHTTRKILRDLQEIEELSATVLRMIKPTIENAGTGMPVFNG